MSILWGRTIPSTTWRGECFSKQYNVAQKIFFADRARRTNFYRRFWVGRLRGLLFIGFLRPRASLLLGISQTNLNFWKNICSAGARMHSSIHKWLPRKRKLWARDGNQRRLLDLITNDHVWDLLAAFRIIRTQWDTSTMLKPSSGLKTWYAATFSRAAMSCSPQQPWLLRK